MEIKKIKEEINPLCRSHITTYINGFTKIDGRMILASRDQSRVTTPASQKNDLRSDDTGRSKDKSLTTGVELQVRHSTTRPNSNRVPRYQSIRARTLNWPPEVEHRSNDFYHCCITGD